MIDLDMVMDNIGKPLSMAIGDGTPNLRNNGMTYYANLAEVTIRRSKADVPIKIVPLSNANIERPADAGISALIMSIEVWDDRTRRSVAPGKGQNSRNHCERAWEHAIALLDRGAESSVVLVGLDSIESINDGVANCVSIGVIPKLIPFRPYPSCGLATARWTDVNHYLEVSHFLVTKLRQSGLAAFRRPDCIVCGACSMEVALPSTEHVFVDDNFQQ